ncbi:hypothetical protein QQF64_002481 [Cirrhinus molitorella]|uniref:Uncharacterized protein n=1 Tax=Cirrhinus molitorella TaxID=172907 RepID=A0ABR3MQ95_9TELE
MKCFRAIYKKPCSGTLQQGQSEQIFLSGGSSSLEWMTVVVKFGALAARVSWRSGTHQQQAKSFTSKRFYFEKLHFRPLSWKSCSGRCLHTAYQV